MKGRWINQYFYFCIIGLLCTQPVYPQSTNPDCTVPPERQFIDAIFNYDFKGAQRVLSKFDETQSLIPSKSFYKALFNWVSGVTRQNNAQIKNSLNALESAVEQLKTIHKTDKKPESLLAWNLAAANTARLLLVNDQILAAYHIGNPAIKKLQLYLQGETTHAGQHAALLALGLHQIYTNALPNKFKWIRLLLNPTGNFHQGRLLLEQVVRNSQHLAPEAARSLLLELPWSNDKICGYLDLSQDLITRYPNNPDFSIARQGVLVRCGWANEALAENKRYLSSQNFQPLQGLTGENYSALFQLGRIRAYVELKDLQSIENEKLVSENLKLHHRFAMANTLDIIGNKKEANTHYYAIVNSASASRSLKTSSKMHLEIPYTGFKKTNSTHHLILADCDNIPVQ